MIFLALPVREGVFKRLNDNYHLIELFSKLNEHGGDNKKMLRPCKLTDVPNLATRGGGASTLDSGVVGLRHLAPSSWQQ